MELLTDNQLSQLKEIKAQIDVERTTIRNNRGKLIISNLVEANFDGETNAEKRTLILVEGDSAKSFVMRGLAHHQLHKDYGVYALSGKLRNAMARRPFLALENVDFRNIMHILGLDLFETYDNASTLRYQHLILMMDQDPEGAHLKGLVIAFLFKLWPSLLKVEGFLQLLLTPAIDVVRKRDNKVKHSFTSIPGYEQWKADKSKSKLARDYVIFYYRGLGSFSEGDAIEIFSNIEKKKTNFLWVNEDDGNAIVEAFSSTHVESRRQMISNIREIGSYIISSKAAVRYSDFVYKDLAWFFKVAAGRSLPSIVDGFRIGQRKVVRCVFEYDKQSYKVEVPTISGYATHNCGYCNGGTSIESVIIRMTQNIVGKHNICVLSGYGIFGSRFEGGLNHANARYLSVGLSFISKYIFRKEDEHILTYLKDDQGNTIEPECYLPILPMILVNGCHSVMPGWKTFVPCFHPLKIIKNLKRLLTGKPYQPMHPFYHGFKGKIESTEGPKIAASNFEQKNYTTKGKVKVIGHNKIKIKELPIFMWTADYKRKLDNFGFVKSYEFCGKVEDGADVCIDVDCVDVQWQQRRKKRLLEKFKLTSRLDLNHMVLLDENGLPRKYKSAEEILRKFFDLRLGFYKSRKDEITEKLGKDLERAVTEDERSRTREKLTQHAKITWYNELDALEKELKALYKLDNQQLKEKRTRKRRFGDI